MMMLLSVRRYLMCFNSLIFTFFLSHSANSEFSLSLLNLIDQVHMEADRKAMANQVNVPADLPFQSKTTYRIRNKVTCSLDH